MREFGSVAGRELNGRAREGRDKNKNSGTFYKDDDSSLELGISPPHAMRGNVLAMTAQGGQGSRSGSEENLTGNMGGKGDIHVRTVIEVNSGK